MGVVHLGVDPHGRAVAIKVLRAHIAYDPDARARLSREVAALSRVRHPRVAEVMDADVDGDQPYVVTRYVPRPPSTPRSASAGPMPPGPARAGRSRPVVCLGSDPRGRGRPPGTSSRPTS